MTRLTTLGTLLSATAHERRKQVPIRLLLALVVSWALFSAGRPQWIGPWVAAVIAVQAFEIVAMFRFRRSTRTPGPADVLLALASTFAMAALFAGVALAIWTFQGRGLQGFAMLIIAGGLLTNVASGIEARSIFFVGASPYLAVLTAMPVLAAAGSPSGDPVLTSLASALFIGAILNVYWRVHAARVAELEALKEAEHRVQQAEEAMADRASMAAIISHELRTPVSAILAGAQVIRDDPGQREETSELIIDASTLMTRMLNDLLDHSKMEAGAMALEARDFDLAGLISDTERFWRAQAAGKGLELHADRPAPGQWVRGDPHRLRQILNNLLSNAIKFTARGRIEVQVALDAGGGAGDAVGVEITVRDQGPGIPPESLDRLFTPFAQGSAEVARTYGGTGLGLKVSRDLARLMGGDLTVASRPGEGAAFSLSLRLPTGTPTAADDQPVCAPDMERRLRILAVDDHEINRRTLALVLQPLGVDLATASDGGLALEMLARQDFDVVLMDVNMPGIDGNETTRRLRASGGPNAGIPVIGFSAGTEARQIAACREAGMTDWLAKPLEPQKLYEALHRATRDADRSPAEAAA